MTRRDDDDFLVRWARRKDAARHRRDAPETEEPAASPAAPPEPASPDDETADETAETELLESLPDIDSLTLESDFTRFLQRGVPEALRRKALRRLWRLDPVFANLDGLNNYDEDYTKLGKVVMPELRSLYRVGQGMLLGESPAGGPPAPEAAGAQTPAAETAESESRDTKSPQSPTEDLKTSTVTTPGPKDAADTQPTAPPEQPAATASLPHGEDEAVRGGAGRAGTRPRSAAARRWGASRQ